MDIKYEVINNEQRRAFEVRAGNELATLTYLQFDNAILFQHTYVPPSLRGHGIGTALANAAFEYAAKINRPVVATCQFVLNHTQKNKAYYRQLDTLHNPFPFQPTLGEIDHK